MAERRWLRWDKVIGCAAGPRALWVAGLWCLGALAARVVAADGDLDPAFGARLLVHSVAQPTHADSLVLSDGRIVALATGSTAGADCPSRTSTGILRLLPDGSPDPAFGDAITPGRTLLLGYCQEHLRLRAVAEQPDGRLVLAGDRVRTDPPQRQAVVVRLASDGAIDHSFGTQGLFTLVRDGGVPTDDIATSVVVLPGPPLRIVVAGAALRWGASDPRAALSFALDADGALLPAGNHVDAAGLRYRIERFPRALQSCSAEIRGLVRVGAVLRALAVASCRIGTQPTSTTAYVLGWAVEDATDALRRAISLDPAVAPASDGHLPEGHHVNVPSVVVEPGAGRLWVAGMQSSPSGDWVGVAALAPSLDFDGAVLGGAGRAAFPSAQGFRPRDIVIQPDGHPVLAGSAQVPAQFAAVRLRADSGAIDLGFGSQIAGMALVAVPFAPQSAATDVHHAPGGGLLLLGSTFSGTGGARDTAAAKLLLATGAGPDALFADQFEP